MCPVSFHSSRFRHFWASIFHPRSLFLFPDLPSANSFPELSLSLTLGLALISFPKIYSELSTLSLTTYFIIVLAISHHASAVLLKSMKKIIVFLHMNSKLAKLQKQVLPRKSSCWNTAYGMQLPEHCWLYLLGLSQPQRLPSISNSSVMNQWVQQLLSKDLHLLSGGKPTSSVIQTALKSHH